MVIGIFLSFGIVSAYMALVVLPSCILFLKSVTEPAFSKKVLFLGLAISIPFFAFYFWQGQQLTSTSSGEKRYMAWLYMINFGLGTKILLLSPITFALLWKMPKVRSLNMRSISTGFSIASIAWFAYVAAYFFS